MPWRWADNSAPRPANHPNFTPKLPMEQSSPPFRIALVDDDSATRAVMERVVESMGAVLDVHSDGTSFLASMEEEGPDLVVIDLLLPLQSGFEVVEKLRSAHPGLPILVVSAVVLEDGCLPSGHPTCSADAYLPKPVGERRFRDRIQGLLSPSPENGPSKMRLLVAEDNDDNADLIRIRLEREEFDVHRAADGVEALRMIDELEPDAILLDIQMPKMGGLEVLANLRERDSDAMVIMMTAYGSEQIAVEAMKRGADDYLTKPLEHRTLVDFIWKSWERNRMRVRNRRLRSQLELSNGELLRRHEALSEALRKLEENQDALVKAQRLAAVTETAVSINHEINNPLCSIMGNTDLLLRRQDLADRDCLRKLKSIERESLRIKDITQKLANLADVLLTDYAGGVKMIDIESSPVRNRPDSDGGD